MSDTSHSDRGRCSRCGRYFKSVKAANQHVADYHKGNGEAVAVAPRENEELSEWQHMHLEKGLPI